MNVSYRLFVPFMRGIALGICALYGIQSCYINEPKEVQGFSGPAAEVIFDTCVNCHAGGNEEGNFGFVDKPEQMIENGIITPGDSANSTIIKRVSEGSPRPEAMLRMPYGGPYLTPTQISNLAAWIDSMGLYTVTVSGQNVSIDPTGEQKVAENKTLTVTVTATTEGFSVRETPGGDCPLGTWKASTYTTGAIVANCSLTFEAYGIAKVTPVAAGATVAPSSVQDIETGKTASFVVSGGSETAYGSCPAGSWSGNTYTTGAIIGNCAVAFPTATEVVILPDISFATTVPDGPTIVTKGATKEFTITVNAGYEMPTTVAGTCEEGSYSGTSYTTGSIQENCTMKIKGYTDNPCPTVLPSVTYSGEVLTVVNKYGCTGCHYPGDSDKAIFADDQDAAPIYDYIINGQDKNFATYIVKKGDPSSSWFYTVLTEKAESVGRMPRGGATIDGVKKVFPSTEEQSQVCNWIYYGANNN